MVKSIFIHPDFTIFVPNVFSPNGDNLNESFKPILHGQTQYRFQIFNRWGTKVFETQDPQAGWDGTFKGEPCQEDVYVWKIIGSNSKQEKTLNGTVRVLR